MDEEINSTLVDVWFRRLDTTVATRKVEAINLAQVDAYTNARAREVLDHLDGVLDGAFSKLQTDDKSNDFWMGVGSALEVAEKPSDPRYQRKRNERV